MRRRGFLPCLAGVAVAGCGRWGRQARKLRVGFIPRYTLAPLYLADELGFFREARLEVEFHPASDSVQMLAPLVGGGLEVSFNMVSAGFINAVLKGARLRLVANRDVAVPGCASGGAVFGSRRAFPRGLHDLRSLKGTRVAIANRAALPAFFLDQVLGAAGMSTADVELVMLRVPEAAAALLGGTIDAVSDTDFDKDLDFVSTNVVRSVTLSELLPNYQYTFVVFGPALLDGDPDIGASFLEAYLRGVREYRAGKTPRALGQLALAAHSSPAAARAACREHASRDGRVDRTSVQRFADWALSKGFVTAAVDAAQLIDTRFVQEAIYRLDRRSGAHR